MQIHSTQACGTMQTLMVFYMISQQFIFSALLISGVNLIKTCNIQNLGIGSGTMQWILQELRYELLRELLASSSNDWMNKQMILQVSFNLNEERKCYNLHFQIGELTFRCWILSPPWFISMLNSSGSLYMVRAM